MMLLFRRKDDPIVVARQAVIEAAKAYVER